MLARREKNRTFISFSSCVTVDSSGHNTKGNIVNLSEGVFSLGRGEEYFTSTALVHGKPAPNAKPIKLKKMSHKKSQNNLYYIPKSQSFSAQENKADIQKNPP